MSDNPCGAPATRLVVSLIVNNASSVVWRAPWRLRCLDRFTDFGLYGAGASWDGPRRPIIDIVPTDAPQRGPRTICIRGIPIDPDDAVEFNTPNFDEDVALLIPPKHVCPNARCAADHD